MTSRTVVCIACLLALMLVTSCRELDTQVAPTYNGPWPAIQDRSTDPSDKIATLGRVLFYDKQLSADNTIACGSCHKQSAGFADNQSFSTGFGGKPTLRNSMPIQNMAEFSLVAVTGDSTVGGYGSASPMPFAIGGLFWDGHESELKKMVLLPIMKHEEMGNMNMYDVGKRIIQLPYYTTLFKEAFGEEPQLDNMEDRVSTALTFFALSIKSGNSKYDKYMSYRQTLTDTEMQGLALFQGKYDCNSCHQVEVINQGTARFANIGLDMTYADNGLSLVTNASGDDGKFRVPSLRNVEYTAPYMHDGRFNTLEEVIQHYSDDIKNNANLHPDLKDERGMARRMDISADETKALIAFLKTMSDPSVLTNSRLSDPFK